ncbi:MULTISPECIES: transporter substrate-binding domain-containing protein [Symbiopectobacterium]|uniref:transporter substrate-binding domain-containing protein n=1 Tax=Symbiopectobacterium TaxID=801 RepID=UPI0020794F02|nr:MULTISPECIES: transporter substrate-binding domain-containing protein [Symbiopectobacterium]MBT9429475.1 transporter substrate-binding domain-containing protein [Candidatus Symbiopectobacterium endolongispinus]
MAIGGFYGIDPANAATADKPVNIVIATSAGPRPFTYFDKDNQLAGYDIDLARAVFSHLSQYKVSFTTIELPSILAGLDSDRFQVGANNFAENKQRKEKYIFTQPIFENQFVIAVSEKNDSIHSLKDLLGKSTEVNPGINFTTALEKYNQQHKENPVNLKYTEAELLPVLQNVASGKEESGLIGAPYSYFLVAKGAKGEILANDINAQLQKLIADGTITAISQKYFHGDYAPK